MESKLSLLTDEKVNLFSSVRVNKVVVIVVVDWLIATLTKAREHFAIPTGDLEPP